MGNQESPTMQVQMVHLRDVRIMVPVDEYRFATHMVAKSGEVGGQLATAWSIIGIPQFGGVAIKNCGPERPDQGFQSRDIIDARGSMAQVKIREDQDGVCWSKRLSAGVPLLFIVASTKPGRDLGRG